MTGDNTISLRLKIGFGLGHILNDLAASIWFTYLLLYFHEVLQFDNTYAGVILFVGQISDGVSTVFVGYFSDAGDDFFLCRTFGRRKAWHIFGTLCLLFTFPFVFLKCVGCQDSAQYAQMFYYVGFVNIVQFGWAAVQISHMAMITELSECPNERCGLTAIRNAATVMANIFVYTIAWYFLGVRERGNVEMIGPEDDQAFRNIVLLCMAIGSLCTLLFYWLVGQKDRNVDEGRANRQITDQENQSQENGRLGSAENDRQLIEETDLTFNEPSCSSSHVLNNKTAARRKISPTKGPNGIVNCTDDEIVSKDRQAVDHLESNDTNLVENTGFTFKRVECPVRMTIRSWFKQPQLYQVAVVYLSTRLFVNLSQAYIPLYLQVTLKLHATSVATVPLVSYISGFIASMILERGKFIFGKRTAFYGGALMAVIGCMWVHFGSPLDEDFTTKQIYGVAILIGFGSSVMMVTSLALTADFIGGDVDSSAFIYGFMSLTDKVCNGLAVVIIQKFVPDSESPFYSDYFANALSWGCGLSALLGILALLSLWSTVIGTRKLSATTKPTLNSDDPSEITPLLTTESKSK